MTPNVHDLRPMRQAIEASSDALAAGDMPFGASLVGVDGSLLLVSRNRQCTGRDTTAHAEMVLVRDATASLGAQVLQGATVYASGEPCAMCAGAMFWAGIRRVVFAATQADIAAALGDPVLATGCAELLATARPAVKVEGPMLRDEAHAVLRRAAVSLRRR